MIYWIIASGISLFISYIGLAMTFMYNSAFAPLLCGVGGLGCCFIALYLTWY